MILKKNIKFNIEKDILIFKLITEENENNHQLESRIKDSYSQIINNKTIIK